MKYLRDYTKGKLVEILQILCLHPANAKIVKTLQNKSYREFEEGLRTLSREMAQSK